jgi:probable rRNA maturation factor
MNLASRRIRCMLTRTGLVARPLVRALERRVWIAGRRLGIERGALSRVGLVLTDDATISRLNRVHMGKRGPTDVLSFPTGEGFELDLAPATSLGLGDIAISWPAVARQARGCSSAALLDEASVLAIHGLAHLLGHDHARAREGRRMHLVERRALAAARVPDVARPYGLRCA